MFNYQKQTEFDFLICESFERFLKETLMILTGKNYTNNLVQKFVKIESWLLLISEIGHEKLHLNTEGVRKERFEKLFEKNIYFHK